MDEHRRSAAVAALNGLASSGDYQDRVDSGIGLVRLLDVAAARPTVLTLVLDPANTLVIRTTAAALARRGDRCAWEILAIAFADADETSSEWIATGVEDAVGLLSADRDQALAICLIILAETSDPAANGASRLAELLRMLKPPLVQVEEAAIVRGAP